LRRAPLVTVTFGKPTPAELAAVLTAVLATARTAVAAPQAPPSRWADRSRALGGNWCRPGPQAWRAAARPR
jgi:hypothetical protein